MRISLGLLLGLISSAAIAGVPNTFVSGQVATAASVNANFTDLDTRATTNAADVAANAAAIAATDGVVDTTLSSIQVQVVRGEPLGEAIVAFASCPAGSIPISAQCFCGGDGTTSNFGILFGCGVDGDGTDDFAFAACEADSFLFDNTLADPPAFVDALCASATLTNGDPATVGSPFGIAAAGAAASMAGAGKATINRDKAAVRLELLDAVAARRNMALRQK